MKRYLCAALAAALMMPGMWAGRARAQDEDAPPEQSGHHGEGMPDGAEMAERMKEKLGLTDEQAGKFKDAMKAHRDALKPLGLRMRDTFKKLADQIQSKAPDADIQASLDALKAARQAMAGEHEKFQDGLAAFLTPTQRGKLAVGMAMRMRREREERGPMGPRRHGPRGGGKARDDKGDGGDDE